MGLGETDGNHPDTAVSPHPCQRRETISRLAGGELAKEKNLPGVTCQSLLNGKFIPALPQKET